MLKKILLPFITVITFAQCVSRNNDGNYTGPAYVGSGVGLGTIIAVVVSWSRNHSILWAIVHGILGWLYVIYAILVKSRDVS